MDLDEYDEQQLLEELASRARLRSFGKCDYCCRPINFEPSCRMHARHRGEAGYPQDTVESGTFQT
jgi:hypothetical protein